MSDLTEIKDCLKQLTKNGAKKKISVLQCNSEYPSPFKDINLRAMNTIAKKFNVNVGLSDHSVGIRFQ